MAPAAAILHSFCSNSNRHYHSPTGHKDPPSPSPRLLKPKQSPFSSSKLYNPSSLVAARTLYSFVVSGRMDEALVLFQSVKNPDAFFWNLMIRGYTNSALYDDAIDFYYRMQTVGVRPDNFTFPFVIKSLTALSSCSEGLKIHGRLFKIGLDSDLFICNSLIAMYSKLGLIDSAETMFDQMPTRDIVTWNSMLAGLVSNGENWKSLYCFKKMQEELKIKPDRFGIMSALEACSSEMSAELGKEIHCHVIRHRLESDVKVTTSLLDMYCKCCKTTYAQMLFDALTKRNVVAWNVMISGYALNNQPLEAIACAIQMQADGIDPDSVTMVNMLPAWFLRLH